MLGFDKKRIYMNDDSFKAGQVLTKIVTKGDTVLFKGSQDAVRLERAVKQVMEHPEDAEQLLVRQSKFWQHR